MAATVTSLPKLPASDALSLSTWVVGEIRGASDRPTNGLAILIGCWGRKSKRPGAVETVRSDLLRLRDTFSKLCFTTLCLADPSTVHVRNLIQCIANAEKYGILIPPSCRRLVVTCSGHGDRESIYTKDSSFLVKDHLVDPLLEIREGQLVGISKLFFIDCCRGFGSDCGIDLGEPKFITPRGGRVPSKGNYLMAYSTLLGMQASHGSSWMQILCSALLDPNHMSKDIQTILVLVNQTLIAHINEMNSTQMQQPECTSTLNEEVMLLKEAQEKRGLQQQHMQQKQWHQEQPWQQHDMAGLSVDQQQHQQYVLDQGMQQQMQPQMQQYHMQGQYGQQQYVQDQQQQIQQQQMQGQYGQQPYVIQDQQQQVLQQQQMHGQQPYVIQDQQQPVQQQQMQGQYGQQQYVVQDQQQQMQPQQMQGQHGQQQYIVQDQQQQVRQQQMQGQYGQQQYIIQDQQQQVRQQSGTSNRVEDQQPSPAPASVSLTETLNLLIGAGADLSDDQDIQGRGDLSSSTSTGTSDNTSSSSSSHKPKWSAMIELKDYCSTKGAKPEYKTKSVSRGFKSVVLCPGLGYAHGEVQPTSKDAENSAAKKALEELQSLKDSL